MKVGINLLLWTARPRAFNHGALLRNIKLWGYDGVEFPLASLDEEQLAPLARMCDELGLARTGAADLDVQSADPASSDTALRRSAVDQMRRYVDRATTLGCPLVAGPLFQGTGGPLRSGPNRAQWQRAVETVRQAAEYAGTSPVRLALEPTNRYVSTLVNTLADGARFCHDVALENVGLLADTYHANIEEANVGQAVADAGELLFHVQISENHRGVPGSGHATGQPIFDALRGAGYNQWLTVEAYRPQVREIAAGLHVWRPTFDDPDQAARDGVHYVRRAWQQAGRQVEGEEVKDEGRRMKDE